MYLCTHLPSIRRDGDVGKEGVAHGAIAAAPLTRHFRFTDADFFKAVDEQVAKVDKFAVTLINQLTAEMEELEMQVRKYEKQRTKGAGSSGLQLLKGEKDRLVSMVGCENVCQGKRVYTLCGGKNKEVRRDLMHTLQK